MVAVLLVFLLAIGFSGLASNLIYRCVVGFAFGLALGFALAGGLLQPWCTGTCTTFLSLACGAIVLIGAILVPKINPQLSPDTAAGDLFGVVGALTLSAAMFGETRIRALAARRWKVMATQHGWRYHDQDTTLAPRWNGSPVAFARTRRGRLRSKALCRAIVEGHDGGLPLRAFTLEWPRGDYKFIRVEPIVTTELPFRVPGSLAVKPVGTQARFKLTVETEVDDADARASGFDVYASSPHARAMLDHELLLTRIHRAAVSERLKADRGARMVWWGRCWVLIGGRGVGWVGSTELFSDVLGQR